MRPASRKSAEEKLIREMFEGIEISETEMMENRRCMREFLNAYFELGCDDDE